MPHLTDSLRSKLLFTFSITFLSILIAVLVPVYFLTQKYPLAELDIFRLTLELVLSITIISIAYAIFMNRVAFQPLEDISRFLSEVAWKKDFSMRIKEGGSKEVRSIHMAVNKLLSTIQDLKQKDLERMNELDKLVKERTAELEKYSRHLETLVEERTKALAEKEKLAAIGEMAVMVGHDMRNPLQVIRYSAYLAKDYLVSAMGGTSDSKLMDYLNRIDKAVEYIDKIVSDLQDFSRPVNVSQFEVSLISILKDAIEQVEIPKNIRVNIEADPSTTVFVDSGLICRVLVNLIINAVQAMPNGGDLKLSANYDGKMITFSVSDTGIGISDDIKEKIFRPFFTTKPKGVGLGLAVVKRIIERLGGSIDVESKVNIGTRFIIKIPTTDLRS